MLRSTRLKLASLLFLLSLPLASEAYAQGSGVAPGQKPPAEAAAPAASAAAPAAAAPGASKDSAKADTSPASASEVAALRAEVAANKAALGELRTAQEQAAAPVGDDVAGEQEKLKIYGFADMGFQYVQINKTSLLANYYDVNDPDFVVGNLNLYFDAQPIQNWRALMEIRFSNAPQGKIENFGGLAGTFSRVNTLTDDPSGAALNAALWGGSTVIERAWLEYNRYQSIKLRVGNWFTPFGIWNEDHGSPTLISLALPQFMTQRWMPLRQTGLMAYGNAFSGGWELGYAATLSNGRQEESTLNIDGRLGFGGRLYARRDTGDISSAFGLSFFAGKTRDKIVNVTGTDPVTFSVTHTYDYAEYVMGADASLDIGRTRIRSEGVVRRLVYTPGLRPELSPQLAPGGREPDTWQETAYLLVAQQLPGPTLEAFEPYLWTEILEDPTIIGDGVFGASAGLNIHFNSAVTWKNQYSYVRFFNWLYDSPNDNSKNDINQFFSRLVMAF